MNADHGKSRALAAKGTPASTIARLLDVFWPPIHEGVPERILSDLRRRQDDIEIPISLAQIIFGLGLLVLYFVSPRGFVGEVPFEPVPWVLIPYVLFSFVRLGLAWCGRLGPGMLYLSIFIDVGVLFGLIWSFHLQYGQPPSFYLKAPELIYICFMISLRSLRFQARYVLATGFTALAGWFFLVLYAIVQNPGGGAWRTRDYAEYLMTNSVLVGAELTKALAIFALTMILALAVRRAGAVLASAVVTESAARDLAHFVPEDVRRRVVASEEGAQSGRGEVREATMLFTDIEGFTSLSETVDPNELITALNDYFTAVAEPIERLGGVINQFIGDAILATFNLPLENQRHAANAVEAAMEIVLLTRERRFGSGHLFRTRAGINTGSVVGGFVGTGERLLYTVYGDAVNTAARLEALNKEYGTYILLSEETRKKLPQGHFALRELGETAIRGRRGSTLIHTLEGAPVGEPSVQSPAGPPTT